MKGYCYLEYYIFYIECDKYEFYSQTYYDKIINHDTATYKTDIFTVLDIFDVNGNKVEHKKYKIGEIINREIYVYFDKDIPCCNKIDKFRKKKAVLSPEINIKTSINIKILKQSVHINKFLFFKINKVKIKATFQNL